MALTKTDLKIFEVTKKDRVDFIKQIVSEVSEGYINPLDLCIQIKIMAEIAKSIADKASFKETLLTEGAKHGKSFDYKNAVFTTTETGVTYDYSFCGDVVLEELEAQAQEALARLSERKEFLKSIPESSGATIVNEDTGEVVRVRRPLKRSTTIISTRLK